MEFIEFIQKILLDHKIISIIGLAKNVSKTTTLNHILNHLSSTHQLGLTSIGRDGERYDIISEFPKPRIKIKKGTFVATAEESIKNSEIDVKEILNTNISTPMGKVLILMAMSEGFIELAGPSNNSGLKKICKQLIDFKCDLVLIDGAFDRKSFASPLISDATILSTGASVSKDFNKVVDETTHIIKLLSIEIEEDPSVRSLINELLSHEKVGFIFEDKSTKSLDLATALTSGSKIGKMLADNVQYVIINGAITDILLEDIMKSTKKYVGITFIVENATKLFISKNIFNKFLKKGGKIKTLHPINIIAITINPTSPYGYNFDKNVFFKTLQDKIKIPIFDLGPN